MAYDLWLIKSILEVDSEFERLDDYRKIISKIYLIISTQPRIKPLIDIPPMADLIINIIRRAIGAYVNRDGETTLLNPIDVHKMDALDNQVYRA